MVFWMIAGLLAAGALLVVFLPLLRGSGAGGRRASYDMQVYCDQLREVDRDVARGVIAEAEAEALRTEIGRKLLAAADAETREAENARAPRRMSLLGGGAVALAALAGTFWLYGGQGAPGYPDQPLALRKAQQAEAWAERPRQAEVEAMAREEAPAPEPDPEAVELAGLLAEALETRPDDVEGHRLLVRAMAGIGRFDEAARAQARVLELTGGEAGAEDHAIHAELMIRAAGGYVSPEAEAAINEALRLDPRNHSARYFLGRMFVQGGWPAEAHSIWSQILAESPPGAPWVAAIEADIDAVAELAGLAPSGPAQPGPVAGMAGEGGVDLAQIEGMVAGLGERLATEGGPPEDWARLIRSLGVLGRISEAASIWEEAQDRFGADESAMAVLTEAAREARLVQ